MSPYLSAAHCHVESDSRTVVALGRRARPLAACVLAVILAGCGSTPPGEGLVDKTLGLIGLQKIESPPAPAMASVSAQAPTPIKVPLRIHASQDLNGDGAKRPLSLVLKVYKLKEYEEFMRAPYDAFSQGTFKNEEVVSSRELLLLPGQRYEVEELMPKGAKYLGVVALFKSPEMSRWRFAFDASNGVKDGFTLGAHRCALSVSRGETVGSAPEIRRLAGSTCR
jgi:type VI secretion system protein VasD